MSFAPLPIDRAIAEFETCTTMQELRDKLQKVSENYGFASFNFLDTGQPHLDLPFYVGTTGEAWEREYISNKFVHVDACVAHARVTNVPFHWGAVALPSYKGRRKPGAIKTMEAARDHGFQEGLVVPYHFADRLGRTHSSLIVFYWKDAASRFAFLMRERRHDLHLLMIYWAQRAVDIIATAHRNRAAVIRDDLAGEVTLTDRERDVVAWAARGKTGVDTAEILRISEDTVDTHMRSVMRKLNASNKTHAVAKAIYFGLISG
ncbi:MAG TPA: LuxR C-terminal-related transcriptional regulator [Beijerinckiaceae bacterium]|nr:LuxR C-terminal-related transcriptional regulator [Beijerinckiaceae bacterium]